MPPLKNRKYEQFSNCIALGKTQTESAILAGYATDSAAVTGSVLIRRPKISARINELMQEIANATLVDAAKLHRRWSEMFEADIADILIGPGKFKPLNEWPKIWRQMLSGLDVKDIFEHSKDGEGASWDKIGELVKIKFISQRELGELIGRHKAVDAFVAQKAQIDVNINLAEDISRALEEGRQRARMRLIDKTA